MKSRASFVNVDDVEIFFWHFLKEALLFWCLFFGRHFGLSLGTLSSGRQHVSLCANDAFIIGIPWANLFSHSLLPKDHFSRKLRKKARTALSEIASRTTTRKTYCSEALCFSNTPTAQLQWPLCLDPDIF